MTTTTKVPDSPCPTCGHVMGLADSVEGRAKPTSGAVAICIRCGACNVFTDKLRLRAITLPEWAELDQATRTKIIEVQHAVRSL